MAPVSSYRMYTEGELIDHIINKLNGVLLIVSRIDFKCPDSGSIINGCILKTPDFLALKVPQRDKFDINLDMMSWNFLGIASCMY